MIDLSELRAHHLDAALRLHVYADDADMRKSDSGHYRKRASAHHGFVATVDRVESHMDELTKMREAYGFESWAAVLVELDRLRGGPCKAVDHLEFVLCWFERSQQWVAVLPTGLTLTGDFGSVGRAEGYVLDYLGLGQSDFDVVEDRDDFYRYARTLPEHHDTPPDALQAGEHPHNDGLDGFRGGSECRQELIARGGPYPRSACAVCGKWAPKSKECDATLAGLDRAKV